MQRWGISESALPPGSEVRFREPSMWERYRAQMLAIIAALLAQAMLIVWLFYEHRRRHLAEVLVRNSMAELTHVNRVATVGEFSASIAHEVNQPLTGIVATASAGRRWLNAAKPNIEEARAAFDKIEVAGHRAADIIKNVRSMFRKDTQNKSQVEINQLIRSVLELVDIDLRKHEIHLKSRLEDQIPPVIGNQVQLQQVILNLIMNAIDAMQPVQLRVLSVESKLNGHGIVQVSIEDNGTGIDPADLGKIFKPMFTTKDHGMGMGLSICHSIIENHNGRIWATAGSKSGTIFHLDLPGVNRLG
jgi:C4-dicarboxylate-specific signal transduction histidine kinase